MGYVLVVGGTKGGTGKSTVAVHIAVALKLAGHSVKLIDGDAQKTSTKAILARDEAGYVTPDIGHATGKEIYKQIGDDRERYDYLIIDVTGTDNPAQRYSLLLADQLLIPLAPTLFTLWSTDEVKQLLEGIRATRHPDLPALLVRPALVKGFPSGDDNRESLEDFHTLTPDMDWKPCKITLGYRKAFAKCFELGQTVYEYRPRGRLDTEAATEMAGLIEEIFGKNIGQKALIAANANRTKKKST